MLLATPESAAAETGAVKLVPASFNASKFTCPRCHAFAGQTWAQMQYKRSGSNGLTPVGMYGTTCHACDVMSYWWVANNFLADLMPEIKLVLPRQSSRALPALSDSAPEAVQAIYEEAAAILDASPRSAAALLRVGLEILVQDLLKDEKARLFDGIGTLFTEGRVSASVKRAADVIRVNGNGAVHPAEIDLEQSIETTVPLFELLALVVEDAIDRQAMIDEMESGLSPGQLEAIAKRDKT